MNWTGGLILASGLKIVGQGVSMLDQWGVGLDNSLRRNQIEQGEWVIDRASEMLYRNFWCKAANTENCLEELEWQFEKTEEGCKDKTRKTFCSAAKVIGPFNYKKFLDSYSLEFENLEKEL